MNTTNLGWKTDLMFLRWLSQVEQHPDHLCIRTPSNPTFHWGNFLYFLRPPQPGDEVTWRKEFARAFPGAAYEAIAWYSPTPLEDDLSRFEALGLGREVCSVMSAKRVDPPAYPNSEIVVRPLESDTDWQQRVECQVACRDEEYGEAGYRAFAEASGRNYRRLQTEGKGAWFGAFIGDRLVADSGLFYEDGVGRFQSVGTHPEFRRRGICQTLIHQVSTIGFDDWGLGELVIVAEDDRPAGRIYASLGYRVTDKQVFLYRSGS